MDVILYVVQVDNIHSAIPSATWRRVGYREGCYELRVTLPREDLDALIKSKPTWLIKWSYDRR